MFSHRNADYPFIQVLGPADLVPVSANLSEAKFVFGTKRLARAAAFWQAGGRQKSETVCAESRLSDGIIS